MLKGKQIVDHTVVKTINGLSYSYQSLTSSNNSNVLLDIQSIGSTHSFNTTWNGILSLDRGGLSNSIFTASQILIINSATNSVVSSGYIFNDNGVSNNDIWSAGKIIQNFTNPTFNNVLINGNLTVSGTTTYLNTENLYIEDNIITLNSTYSGVPILDSGIEINRGVSVSSRLIWDETLDYWKLGLSGSESIIITDAGNGLTKNNNQLAVSYSVLASNLQGNGLTANGLVLDVNVNSESLEIQNDLIRLKDTIIGDRNFTGSLTVSGYKLDSQTWSASQILTINASTNSVIGSGYKFNDLGTASTDVWSARQIIDNVISTTLTGARNANATNIYLRNNDGLPYNTTPFILPYNGTIKYISMANSGIETWVGEVRNNGVAITGATLSLVASTSTYSTFNINVNAGAKLQLYCNGTGVNSPRMNVQIAKR